MARNYISAYLIFVAKKNNSIFFKGTFKGSVNSFPYHGELAHVTTSFSYSCYIPNTSLPGKSRM